MPHWKGHEHDSKALATRIIPELQPGGKEPLRHDSSTNTLIRRYQRSKQLSDE
jgi:glucose-6-phosphate isomerase